MTGAHYLVKAVIKAPSTGENVMNTLSMLKSSAKVFAAILAVASMSAVSHAQGQIDQVKVNVPFAFETGTSYMPAGVYKISMEQNRIMLVKGNTKAALLLTRLDEDRSPVAAGKVVFHRYGNRYFLREVWTPGRSSHFECDKSKAEKSLVLARNESAPSNVELALLDSAH